ncbi:EscU/YscU/HrcU family type III secretion system export apparatus switch protein [Vogesella oryzae]|uniref:EscU/YscU/HrcU family type III secretion system export apparatus switch protein n=1 Tax=Vogesella oryzae TaxID=1735285 RepID=UPI0015832FEE|nr:flagellar type III secretion system protein FlhB [Vogesella oryzae]
MAEHSSGDKTEKPSQQKLRKAREAGQVVRSRDVATAIGIVLSLKLLLLLMPGWLDDFRRLFALGLTHGGSEGALDNALSEAFPAVLWLLAKMLLPLAVIPLAIVAGSMIPGGWMFSMAHWQPKLERLSPAANLGRMFSGKQLLQVGSSLLKAMVLALLLWHLAADSRVDYLRLQSLPLSDAIVLGAGMMLDGALALGTVFVLFALLDLPLQWLLFQRGQRMSKQEVKEEHKSNEGRPEVKNRIRQLQRQFAMRGLRKAVPQADVVIVNPTHYAVALKYDDKRAEAPFVLAKGVDEMAQVIRELAGSHRIEILELPPLARAIYNTSQVNQQIPAALYQAVAQVLTYVLQLKAFRNGRRRREPQLPADFNLPQELTEPR